MGGDVNLLFLKVFKTKGGGSCTDPGGERTWTAFSPLFLRVKEHDALRPQALSLEALQSPTPLDALWVTTGNTGSREDRVIFLLMLFVRPASRFMPCWDDKARGTAAALLTLPQPFV